MIFIGVGQHLVLSKLNDEGAMGHRLGVVGVDRHADQVSCTGEGPIQAARNVFIGRPLIEEVV